MAWAWWSLFAVCFADFWVRMCSMGVVHDPTLMTFRNLLEYGNRSVSMLVTSAAAWLP
jgi:hypothetical protein